MNKTQLIDQISKETGLTKKDSQNALEATISAVTKTLKKGQPVQLVGFGTFKVSKRKARTGRNPQTNEPIKIKACKAPTFRPGKALKEAVNKR